MNSKDQIIKALQVVTRQKEINLEFPEREEFGDFSSNIALRAGNKNPRAYAQEIIEKLQKDRQLAKVVEKIEAAGAGFINFWLKKEYLTDNLKSITDLGDQYGMSKDSTAKKIMVEFAHPNTHKPFHIGHLRNITTGEAISRLLISQGGEVIRVNYQGDVGLHIAKAIRGIEKLGFADPKDVKARAEFLGKAYVTGNQAYEEGGEEKEKIHKINEELYSKTNQELNKLYELTRRWSLDYLDTIYQRVSTKFDRLYFESEVAQEGKNKAESGLKEGILEKSDGAVIFPGEKYGLHSRVFITSLGVPTYEAKDLGLALIQFGEYNPDVILHIVGPEQSEYFKVIFKALELIEPETKGREVHIPYGWVKLKKGKMSSRSGNVVLGDWLLDEVKDRIIEKHKTGNDIAEQIAVGAVKYSFLKCGLTQEIAFDIDESISVEGNSGPYLQYTVARINSVVTKQIANDVKSDLSGQNSKLNQEEILILRALSRFFEVVTLSAKTYSPNLLCNYLYDLASKFNTFYNKHKIIGGESEDFKLLLTESTGQVLKNGLNLLGIQTPEKM